MAVLIVLAAGAAIGAAVTTFVRMHVGPGQSKPTLENITSFLTAGALIVAVATYRFSAVKSKKDLFVTLHQSLIAPEVQEARRTLMAAKQASDVAELEDSKRREVNRALALYETLAIYTADGSVSKREVWQVWGSTILRQSYKIKWFIDAREDAEGYRSWPYLEILIAELKSSPPRPASA